MSDAYVHQSYPKCVYVQDKTGKVCAETVQSPKDLEALENWAESPVGPFKRVQRAAATVKKSRKTKRSKS